MNAGPDIVDVGSDPTASIIRDADNRMTCPTPASKRIAASKPVTNFMSLPWFEQTDLIVLRDARNSNSFVRVRVFV